MNATTLTITRRSKIGFSWTNSAEQRVGCDGRSYLCIEDPADVPRVVGSVGDVCEEFERVARLNNSNDWRRRWFVRRNRKWVPVSIDPHHLWSLLDPTWQTDSIEAQVIDE